MNRTDAIHLIVKDNPDAIFVFSNGLTSRFAADILGLNGPYLYLIHGMGESLSVGLGLASCLKKQIVVVDGDGNALMGLASWSQLKLFDNICYYILDNGKHATTGGQKIPDFSFLDVKEVNRIKIDSEDSNLPPVPPKPDLIIQSFKGFLHAE